MLGQTTRHASMASELLILGAQEQACLCQGANYIDNITNFETGHFCPNHKKYARQPPS